MCWVKLDFPSQDERSCSLLPRFPPTRGARRALVQPYISFAELSRPGVGRPGVGRDTGDSARFLCVCLGPVGAGGGSMALLGVVSRHPTAPNYDIGPPVRAPRRRASKVRTAFLFIPLFSFSLFLFNIFQNFCVTNKYKREHTYIHVLNTSY